MYWICVGARLGGLGVCDDGERGCCVAFEQVNKGAAFFVIPCGGDGIECGACGGVELFSDVFAVLGEGDDCGAPVCRIGLAGGDIVC